MGTTNYQQLAREFMNLWQKQLSSVVSDKQFIQAMLEMMQSFQNPNSHGQKPASPANAATASDDVDGGMANLAFRLSMCERRLAALEAAFKSGAKKPTKSGAGAGGRKGSRKPRA